MLDRFDNIKSITKIKCPRLYGKIKFLEGQLFLKLLNFKDSAENCFKIVLDIGNEEFVQHEPWFMEATVLYQELKKTGQREEDSSKKEKGAILEELREQLNKLDQGTKLSLGAFVTYLFENFPVQHKVNVVKPSLQAGKEKKTLIKLAALYHPDKIDEAVYGDNYKVLCEEIVKRINDRIQKYM